MLNASATLRVPSLRQYGFTLIELMVTITLLAVLFGLAFPAFTTWIRNTQIRSVAESLQNGLRAAQNDAVRRSRTVVFYLTYAEPVIGATALPGGRNWVAQYVPLPMDSPVAPEPVVHVGKAADVSPSVLVSATAGAATVASVCFNSSGRLVTSTAATTGITGTDCAAATTTFNVTQSSGADRPLRVIVDLGGRVRMCDPARPSTAPDGC